MLERTLHWIRNDLPGKASCKSRPVGLGQATVLERDFAAQTLTESDGELYLLEGG